MNESLEELGRNSITELPSMPDGRLVELQKEVDAARTAYLEGAKTRRNPESGELEVYYRDTYLKRDKGWRSIAEAERVTSDMLPRWLKVEADILSLVAEMGLEDLQPRVDLIGSLAIGLPQESSDMEAMVTSPEYRAARDALVKYKEGDDNFDHIYKKFMDIQRSLIKLRNRFLLQQEGDLEIWTIPKEKYGYPVQVAVGLKGLIGI